MDSVHQHVAPDLALYAIGAVDPAEILAIDAHLATCARCQDELVRLRDAAALLAPVSRRDLDLCWDRIAAQVRGTAAV
jgi:anti-sigma factor ChrR (cupin superfamily)